MRFITAILAFIVLTLPAYAAEDTQPVVPAIAADTAIADAVAIPTQAEPPAKVTEVTSTATDPGVKTGWREIVAWAVTAIGTLLATMLAKQGTKKAESYEAQAALAGQDTKKAIVARVKAFIWRRASAIQEENLPELAAAVVRGSISGDQVKKRLKAFGDRLLSDAVDYFDQQDIDLVGDYGKAQIISWIRSAVDDISVFKKWPTAKTLLEGGAESILTVGINRAGDYYDKLRDRVAMGENVPSGGAAGKVADKINEALVKDLGDIKPVASTL